MRRAVTAITLLLLLTGSIPALGEIPPLLRPGTHRMWFSFGLGPAIELSGPWISWTQFKLQQTFGFHFFGEASGPAIAIDMEEAFGGGFVSIELGPKFVWDIQIIKDLGFYLSPGARAGFAWAGTAAYHDYPQGRVYYQEDIMAFNLNFSFDAKLILADRGMVFFRPMAIDLGIREDLVLRYDILFGGGVIF